MSDVLDIAWRLLVLGGVVGLIAVALMARWLWMIRSGDWWFDGDRRWRSR